MASPKRGSLEKQNTSFQWKMRTVAMTEDGLKYSRPFPMPSCLIQLDDMIKVDYIPRTRRFNVIVHSDARKILGPKSPSVFRRKSSAMPQFETLYFRARDAEEAAEWTRVIVAYIDSCSEIDRSVSPVNNSDEWVDLGAAPIVVAPASSSEDEDNSDDHHEDDRFTSEKSKRTLDIDDVTAVTISSSISTDGAAIDSTATPFPTVSEMRTMLPKIRVTNLVSSPIVNSSNPAWARPLTRDMSVRTTRSASITYRDDGLGANRLDRINQYEIIRKLGEGATANVYLCRYVAPTFVNTVAAATTTTALEAVASDKSAVGGATTNLARVDAHEAASLLDTFREFGTDSAASTPRSPSSPRTPRSPVENLMHDMKQLGAIDEETSGKTDVSSNRGIRSRASVKSVSRKPDTSSEFQSGDLFALKVFSKLKMRKNVVSWGGNGNVVTAMDRVRTEVALMKKLRHENLVRLYEIVDCEESDALYLVLTYVAGGQVMVWDAESCRYRTPLSTSRDTLTESDARRYIRDVLCAVSYLHTQRIAHRDIKPENVLVDTRGRAVLADFGVAHFFTASNRSMRLMKTEGTHCFWPPEYCRAAEAQNFPKGFPVDIWSIGVTLFAFVFGNLPFWSPDASELFRKIVHEPLRFPKAPSGASSMRSRSVGGRGVTGRKDSQDRIPPPLPRERAESLTRSHSLSPTRRRTKRSVSETNILRKIRATMADGEQPTYMRVKSKLVDAFGLPFVNEHKSTIMSALQEMDRELEARHLAKNIELAVEAESTESDPSSLSSSKDATKRSQCDGSVMHAVLYDAERLLERRRTGEKPDIYEVVDVLSTDFGMETLRHCQDQLCKLMSVSLRRAAAERDALVDAQEDAPKRDEVFEKRRASFRKNRRFVAPSPYVSAGLLGFLSQLLEKNAHARMTVNDAFKHRWINANGALPTLMPCTLRAVKVSKQEISKAITRKGSTDDVFAHLRKDESEASQKNCVVS